MPLNAEWHRKHRLPRNASHDDRIAWHLEHAERCGCRPVPEALRREVEARLGGG